MTNSVSVIAEGPGWWVADVVCSAGPTDRAFEELHSTVCVAAVTAGTFRYRTRAGTAITSPGAVILGEAGQCFECSHDHGRGDRCLAFHFAPALFEVVAADVPGARSMGFGTARLPPSERMLGLLAEAEAARDDADRQAFDELAVRLAGAALSLAGGAQPSPAPSGRDQKRVADALRLIELDAERPVCLGDLASAAATSPYHFVRSFSAVAGMTPYRYLLRTRLHRAALRLARSQDAIGTIAYDAGFADLSTFNRRFRRVMGETPSAWRARKRGRPGTA